MRENLKTASKLLGDFVTFIDNRSIVLLMWPNEALPKILEWHFEAWQKEYRYLAKNNSTKEWIDCREILIILESILQRIEERVFRERGASSFFQIFKEHTEKFEKEYIENQSKDKKYYYVESLLSIFYQVFFKVIESSSERHAVWNHYFPKEWKITKSNLKNKENIIVRISLNEFLKWALEKIREAEESYNKDLDGVSLNLFPEVDPISWSKILIFLFSPYGENRVKSVIERPWNFGSIGRVKTYFEYEDSGEFKNITRKKELDSTFELVYLLFSEQFSKENLEKYIKDIKGLKYEKENKEENKRLRLLKIFENMLEYEQRNISKNK